MSNYNICKYPTRHEYDFSAQTRESEDLSYNWTNIPCKNCDYEKRVWVKDTAKLTRIPLENKGAKEDMAVNGYYFD